MTYNNNTAVYVGYYNIYCSGKKMIELLLPESEIKLRQHMCTKAKKNKIFTSILPQLNL